MPTPNKIKFTTTQSNGTIKVGNYIVGVSSGVTYGPTSVTGFYQSLAPVTSGFTIHQNKATLGPSTFRPNNDTEFINLTRILGGNVTGVTDSLVYLSSQSDIIVVNRTYEEIVTSGLTFCVDAGYTPSYLRSGTTWTDLSFSGSNGTFTNGPTFNINNGGSIVFDGVDDYINFGNKNLGLDLVNKSFCAWVYLGSTLSNPTGIIDKDFDTGPGVYGGWGFWVGSDRKLWWWNTANQDIRDTGTTIGTNVWTHVAVTYNSTSKTATFYVNGSLSSSSSNSSVSELSSGTQPLVIGCIRNGVGAFLNGRITNVLAYNRILSASEVLQNYNAQKSRFGL